MNRMASNLDLDGIDADISADSIRAVADSLGISRLDDSALRALAEDVSFRLKQIVQVKIGGETKKKASIASRSRPNSLATRNDAK